MLLDVEIGIAVGGPIGVWDGDRELWEGTSLPDDGERSVWDVASVSEKYKSLKLFF